MICFQQDMWTTEYCSNSHSGRCDLQNKHQLPSAQFRHVHFPRCWIVNPSTRPVTCQVIKMPSYINVRRSLVLSRTCIRLTRARIYCVTSSWNVRWWDAIAVHYCWHFVYLASMSYLPSDSIKKLADTFMMSTAWCSSASSCEFSFMEDIMLDLWGWARSLDSRLPFWFRSRTWAWT